MTTAATQDRACSTSLMNKGEHQKGLPLPLVARTGYSQVVAECLLSGVKLTSVWTATRSENDPIATSAVDDWRAVTSAFPARITSGRIAKILVMKHCSMSGTLSGRTACFFNGRRVAAFIFLITERL
jgi:hypothetical protein